MIKQIFKYSILVNILIWVVMYILSLNSLGLEIDTPVMNLFPILYTEGSNAGLIYFFKWLIFTWIVSVMICLLFFYRMDKD